MSLCESMEIVISISGKIFVTYFCYTKIHQGHAANHRTPIIWNAMHILKNNYRIFRSITDLRDYLA